MLKIRHKANIYCTLTDEHGNKLQDDVPYDRLAEHLLRMLTPEQHERFIQNLKVQLIV